jgi:outer membrane protein, heavy metal efflux system
MRGLNTALGLWATTAIACGGGNASLVIDDDIDGAAHAHAPSPPQLRQASPPAPPSDAAPAPRPDPAAGKPVSLDELLTYADQHAPALVVAIAGRQRAEAERTAASPLFPEEPIVSGAAGRRRGSGDGGEGWDFEVGLDQRVEIAGQRGTRRDAAERTGERVEAEIAGERWRVHQRVHLAFHAALVARERALAATRLREFSERLVEVANKRLTAGDISRLQVRVAEGELAMARERQIADQQQYAAARLVLAETTGWPANNPPAPAGALDAPRDTPAADRLVRTARVRHPQLVQLRAAVGEAEAKRRVAVRETWPDIDLGVSLAREADVGDGEVDIALFRIGIPLPLFRQNRGERARAAAEVRVAEAERDAEAAMLDSRVRRAASAVNAAAARVRAYGSEIVPRFQENLDLLVRAFELGEVDVLNVLVARERFLEVQRAVLDAYGDYYEAVGSLEAEVGVELWPEDRHEHEPEVPR